MYSPPDVQPTNRKTSADANPKADYYICSSPEYGRWANSFRCRAIRSTGQLLTTAPLALMT